MERTVIEKKETSMSAAGRGKSQADPKRDLVFGLPNRIFTPISSPARRSYARLLLRLHRDFLEHEGGLPQLSQKQVIAVIGDLMLDGESFVDEFSLDTKNAKMSEKPANVYRKLVDAGWFNELISGFDTIVTMRSSVARLLSALDSIDKGQKVNFTGTLQLVDSALDNLMDDPSGKSMTLEQAVRSSETFSQSMTALLDGIRSNEREIVLKTNPDEMVDFFFDQFVSKIVTDYKAVKVRHNPIRIAASVISKIVEIKENDEVLSGIADGYVEFGLADDPQLARQLVLDHLEAIRRVFHNVRKVMDDIDRSKKRVEDRFLRFLRFSESSSEDDMILIEDALEAIGRVPDWIETDEIESLICEAVEVFGPATLSSPVKAKARIGRIRVKERKHSAAFTDLAQLRNDQAAALSVTPSELRSFIDTVLAGADEAELSIDESEKLRDMVLLSSARQVEVFNQGELADAYVFIPHDGLNEGKWSIHRAGRISRTQKPSLPVSIVSRMDPSTKKRARAFPKKRNKQ